MTFHEEIQELEREVSAFIDQKIATFEAQLEEEVLFRNQVIAWLQNGMSRAKLEGRCRLVIQYKDPSDNQMEGLSICRDWLTDNGSVFRSTTHVVTRDEGGPPIEIVSLIVTIPW